MTSATVEELADVEAWVFDPSKPMPSPAALAAFVAKQVQKDYEFVGREPGWARDTMLRLATVALAIGSCLQGSREANGQLRAACQSAAHTTMIAIERLQQQEELVIAALAWVRGNGDVSAIEKAARNYDKIVKARS